MQAGVTWLTVDQGNSSLDAVLFALEGDLRVLRSWDRLEPEQLESLATELQPRGVSYTSVRGPAAAARLEQILRGAFGHGSLPACGLELAVDSPETVGKDRLFAARAAWDLARPKAAVVVDVGTAMTVDLVRDGAFQGGAIAPGPSLLAHALGAGAAQLYEIEPKPGAPALGRDTRAALEAGVVVGLRGAARALVEELLEAAGPGARVFVTGGARCLLLEPRGFLPGVEVLEVPDLVHLGLVLAGAGPMAVGAKFEDFGEVHPAPSRA